MIDSFSWDAGFRFSDHLPDSGPEYTRWRSRQVLCPIQNAVVLMA
jgi:hypothetical protein